jgi:hypothetical protein
MGSMHALDATVLVELLRAHMPTGGPCWCCIWEGWGWVYRVVHPPRWRVDSPRVHLPGRDYVIYSGPIDDALAFVESERQTPNLFWPKDRSWCVATEIDYTSTYVGGSRALIDRILADHRIEALPAELTDDSYRIDQRLSELVDRATETVLDTGHIAITTGIGIIQATLGGSLRPDYFRVSVEGIGTRSTGGMNLRGEGGDDLRRDVMWGLEDALLRLAGR